MYIPGPSTPQDPLSSRPLSAAGTGEVARLQVQVERLLMITEALWGILKEQHGFDDKELQKRIVEIDLRDGRMDGKVAAAPPTECPKCGRTIAKQSIRCMYCGEPLLMDPFAR
ncbi:MAG: hypothetical protein PHQ12_00885 [Chthoniobacteraceae bacterium]|nr:hypothetical protein [Chthoniobacteraceae bacterium]